MKPLIVILCVILILSCTKEPLQPACQQCYLVSQKYTLDSVYISTDTLWQDRVCGLELAKVRAAPQVQWILNCGVVPNIIERWTYFEYSDR